MNNYNHLLIVKYHFEKNYKDIISWEKNLKKILKKFQKEGTETSFAIINKNKSISYNIHIYSQNEGDILKRHGELEILCGYPCSFEYKRANGKADSSKFNYPNWERVIYWEKQK